MVSSVATVKTDSNLFSDLVFMLMFLSTVKVC